MTPPYASSGGARPEALTIVAGHGQKSGGWMEQRFLFNQVADLYDQARAGYPPALFDDVASAAKLSPGDRMLEVGCGTGKATEGFAAKGLDILALDPGGEMIAAARRRLAAYAQARFAETTFEAWPVQPGAFKLVAAAQSWHWVAPDIRFVKAAQALASGGALAVFGSVQMDAPSPLREALGDIYLRRAPELGGRPPEHSYLPDGPFQAYFEQSRLFGPVRHKAYAWARRFSAQSYIEYLASVSRYQMMEASRREALLVSIGEAIDAYGGAFDLPHETHLYMAAKLP
jgi:ubiquinone/menaquinone biosynthesis C-methylase UbiE